MIGFASSIPVVGGRATFCGGQDATCAAPQKSATVARFVMMADEKKGPLGGLGGLGDIMGAMKKAQEFSSSAKTLQDELKETEIEASVRDGAVTIIMTGQQHPLSVKVSDELAKEGGEEVSKAVTECLVAAHSKRCVHIFRSCEQADACNISLDSDNSVSSMPGAAASPLVYLRHI